MSPNPHKDAKRESFIDRIIDAVHETNHPSSTWGLIVGSSLVTLAFLIGLAAVWAPDDLHGKLGGTAAMFGIPGVVTCFISGMVKDGF